MSQEITVSGKVIAMDGPVTFASGFKKTTVVIETPGEYPQPIPVEFVKDKADAVADAVAIGDTVTASINLRGREYNGRYFPSNQGWKFTVDEKGSGYAGGDHPAEAIGDDDGLAF